MATIDPNSLVGAKTSPWRLLANASITFTQVVSETVDASTGNPRPLATNTLTVRAYFKKANLELYKTEEDSNSGVPIGSYPVKGYTIGILPDWCKVPSAPALPCTIDNLGSGVLTFQGRIHVVKSEVEKAGSGSQIQGYFTMQGSR